MRTPHPHPHTHTLYMPQQVCIRLIYKKPYFSPGPSLAHTAHDHPLPAVGKQDGVHPVLALVWEGLGRAREQTATPLHPPLYLGRPLPRKDDLGEHD